MQDTIFSLPVHFVEFRGHNYVFSIRGKSKYGLLTGENLEHHGLLDSANPILALNNAISIFSKEGIALTLILDSRIKDALIKELNIKKL